MPNREPIIITATFDPSSYTPPAISQPTDAPNTDNSVMEQENAILPTAPLNVPIAQDYVVQPGDTLSGIAARFGVSLEALQAVNQLQNADILSVGQVLRMPEAPTQTGSDLPVLPDNRLVRAPGSGTFDVAEFVRQQPGYLRLATDDVNDQVLTGAQIVQRVALEYSVDPRVLLALLEFKGQWLTNAAPSDEVKTYPLGAPASEFGFDRDGLYRQLTWAADRLNTGFYRWMFGSLSTLEFEDGTRLRIAPSLNAGTVGVQYVLSQYNDYYTWNDQVSPNGFAALYTRYFGDPFAVAGDELIPDSLIQPELTFPFSSGEVWLYTGGPHGGWGDGSAWSAVDFAPPDERLDGSPSCYVSEYFATAAADGVIARSGEGTVILDLDGDGDETTGWTLLYLHVDTRDRVAIGTRVSAGDPIGRPSCEGGFSTGTHLHLARRYNGVWLPASCSACNIAVPPFVMSGWTVVGLPDQLYQGFLQRGGERRIAEQGRLVTENRVSW